MHWHAPDLGQTHICAFVPHTTATSWIESVSLRYMVMRAHTHTHTLKHMQYAYTSKYSISHLTSSARFTHLHSSLHRIFCANVRRNKPHRMHTSTPKPLPPPHTQQRLCALQIICSILRPEFRDPALLALSSSAASDPMAMRIRFLNTRGFGH